MLVCSVFTYMMAVIWNFDVAYRYDWFILWLYVVFAADTGDHRDPWLAKVTAGRMPNPKWTT